MVFIDGKSSSDSVILNTSFSSFIVEEGSGDRSCPFNNNTDGRWWSIKTMPRLKAIRWLDIATSCYWQNASAMCDDFIKNSSAE
jgi:hypothetical protein